MGKAKLMSIAVASALGTYLMGSVIINSTNQKYEVEPFLGRLDVGDMVIRGWHNESGTEFLQRSEEKDGDYLSCAYEDGSLITVLRGNADTRRGLIYEKDTRGFSALERVCYAHNRAVIKGYSSRL